MAYAITISEPQHRLTRPHVTHRTARGIEHASEPGPLRSALAMCESMLVSAHVRYRRIRYRHMAN